jgi:insulysin
VAYDGTALGSLIKVVPVKDLRMLDIKWPMLPDTRHLWEGNPLSYISHIIGHEGKNSLLSELIR